MCSFDIINHAMMDLCEKWDTMSNDETLLSMDESTILSNDISRQDHQIQSNHKDTDIGKGSMLLDIYDVLSGPIAGGMGQVFRVHHQSWGIDLALKQPHAHLFQTDEQVSAFIHECDAWINMGLHPHIVSCYYVREINGIPSIFSEWMDGGSLADWIKSGKLYEGSIEDQLKRIVDIAIQYARGLSYAHENGLIHQDVKPDNVLLSQIGTAKIADFGIAKARSVLSSAPDENASHTLVSNSGAYTPAYCSPEQEKGDLLTLRTDIWSWGVTFLEMLLGDRPWNNGVVAGMGYEDYFEFSRFPITPAIEAIFDDCFEPEEKFRFKDFKEIETSLLTIYEETTGLAYERIEPTAAKDTADSLNNRALSYLDMDKESKAEETWNHALALEPTHLECNYNLALHLWRNSRIDDIEVLNRVSHATTSELHKQDYAVAQINMERGNLSASAQAFESIKDSFDVRKELDLLATEDLNHLVEESFISQDIKFQYPALFSPDDLYLLCRGKQNGQSYFYLIERATNRLIKRYEEKSGSPFLAQGRRAQDCDTPILCFHPDGGSFFSANKTIIQWDIETGNQLQLWDNFSEDVSCIAISEDGKYLVSGHFQQEAEPRYPVLRTWDIETGTCLVSVLCESDGSCIKDIVLSQNGRKALVLVDNRNACFMYDTIEKETLYRIGDLFDYTDTISTNMCISADKNIDTAIFASKDNMLGIYDLVQHSNYATQIKGYKGTCAAVLFNNNTSMLSLHTDYKTGEIKLWETETLRCLYTFSTGYMPFSLDLSHDETTFVVSSMTLNDAPSSTAALIHRVPASRFKAKWMLSKIETVSERLGTEECFERHIKDFDVALEQKDIAKALALLEQARSLPGFEHSRACHDCAHKIKSFSRIKRLKSMYTESTYPKGSHLPQEYSPLFFHDDVPLPLQARASVYHPDGNHVLTNNMELINIETKEVALRYDTSVVK